MDNFLDPHARARTSLRIGRVARGPAARLELGRGRPRYAVECNDLGVVERGEEADLGHEALHGVAHRRPLRLGLGARPRGRRVGDHGVPEAQATVAAGLAPRLGAGQRCRHGGRQLLDHDGVAHRADGGDVLGVDPPGRQRFLVLLGERGAGAGAAFASRDVLVVRHGRNAGLEVGAVLQLLPLLALAAEEHDDGERQQQDERDADAQPQLQGPVVARFGGAAGIATG
ncbi:hypothetical protein ON010_g11395 [Phytophthora cinnamomi]|nr:hypothetical protein ON010_g11395 [Phytophthora cinnamomi]